MVVRACADDVGIAMFFIGFLVHAHECYTQIARISNLTLKPAKCVIVPLAAALTDALTHTIQTWLAQHVPDWKHFKVVSAGKYLGYYLGPAARSIRKRQTYTNC